MRVEGGDEYVRVQTDEGDTAELVLTDGVDNSEGWLILTLTDYETQRKLTEFHAHPDDVAELRDSLDRWLKRQLAE